MLETLAGRLKWERTTDGIRVVVPSHFNGWIYLTGIGLLTFPQFTYELFGRLTAATGQRLLIPGLIGLVLFALWITFLRTHEIALTVSPNEMAVELWAFGIKLKTRKAATSRLTGLRFVPAEYGIGIDDMNRIQFRKDQKRRNLGHGITEEEADALIAKMMEVYPFPERVAAVSEGSGAERG